MNPDPILLPDGTYEAVGPDQLKARTAAGCRLVRILNGTHGVQYLLLEQRDATHEGLREQIFQLEAHRVKTDNARWEAEQRAKATERQRRVTEDQLARATAALDAEADRLAAREADIERLHQSMGKLEQDMARVRKFVGEKTWAEALARDGE